MPQKLDNIGGPGCGRCWARADEQIDKGLDGDGGSSIFLGSLLSSHRSGQLIVNTITFANHCLRLIRLENK